MNRGFVLVNALILIAALSAVAVAILSDRQESVGKVAVAAEAARADMVARAGLTFAADLLRRDARQGGADHAGEGWALDAFPAEAGDGIARVTVSDLSGRFNLNLLAGEDGAAATDALLRFAEAAGIGIETARGIAAQLENAVPGRQDDEGPTFFFATGEVSHLSQLIGASDSEGLADLAPLVAALPGRQKINVNTAPPELLSALVRAETDISTELVAIRDRTPFAEPGDFARAVEGLAGPEASVATSLIGTGSDWFLVEVEARHGETIRHVATILARNPETGDVEVFMQGPMGTE